jgi:hypothetical protein
MKAFKFSMFSLLIVAMVGFSACGGSDSEANDEARESLASAPAKNDATKPATKPATKVATPTGPTTALNFGETSFDFGQIDEGEKVSHVYKFENTGKEPLVISNAKGSCGCTVPKWPKNPIAPGEAGEILVTFNSKGKTGKQTKRVTITANTDPAQTFLTITGNVAKVAAKGK